MKTVPSFEPETNQEHTAYTVYRICGGDKELQYAAGWTLRDAIGVFCSKYFIQRDIIQLIRPFRTQKEVWNECCWV